MANALTDSVDQQPMNRLTGSYFNSPGGAGIYNNGGTSAGMESMDNTGYSGNLSPAQRSSMYNQIYNFNSNPNNVWKGSTNSNGVTANMGTPGGVNAFPTINGLNRGQAGYNLARQKANNSAQFTGDWNSYFNPTDPNFTDYSRKAWASQGGATSGQNYYDWAMQNMGPGTTAVQISKMNSPWNPNTHPVSASPAGLMQAQMNIPVADRATNPVSNMSPHAWAQFLQSIGQNPLGV